MLKPEKFVGSLVLRRYRLDEVISSGGMGVLYRATHLRTGRKVALKYLLDRDDNERFALEARSAVELKHPNVVDVIDMDEDDDGVAFMVLELLDGLSLAQVLQKQPRLNPAQCLEWLLPIMGALAVAHDRGILHRDLKPANIFIAQAAGGRTIPKLLDFGVAKVQSEPTLTRSGAVVGTPSYMSPEQARGDRELFPTTDVWGMGVIWFRCLTGRLPFEHEAVIGTLMRIVNERAPRIDTVVQDVPRALGWAVDRALQYDVTARYADMRPFARALLAACMRDGLTPPVAPDPSGLPDWSKWMVEEQRLASTGTGDMVPAVQPTPRSSPSVPPPTQSAAAPAAPLAPRAGQRPELAPTMLDLAAAAASAPALADSPELAPAAGSVSKASAAAARGQRARGPGPWLMGGLALVAFVTGAFLVLSPGATPPAQPAPAPKAASKVSVEPKLSNDKPTRIEASRDLAPAAPAPLAAPAPVPAPSPAPAVVEEKPKANTPDKAVAGASAPDPETKKSRDRKKRASENGAKGSTNPGTPSKPVAADEWSIETSWR